jgi:hypothetical protein
MSRVRFFSTLSETFQGLKRHKTGVPGSVLGKEMGKDFATAPVSVKDAARRLPGDR